MNKLKIINDPVYGFITLPHELIFDLIEHRYFQRLRRIYQVGLTHYVYPGAVHTRFHHAIGAMHLMMETIEVLRSKKIDISREEALAAYVAILLHDIGHGPFSHTLEYQIIDVSHEKIGQFLIRQLNQEFDGALDQAILIYENKHPRDFLNQLVSSQLDLDRMDYLNRDSFFSGVAEGKIGYHRIIKMMNVVDNRLVVEEKGIYSIEKFLLARRFMYAQVYSHRAGLSAEHMLKKVIQRAKQHCLQAQPIQISPALYTLLTNTWNEENFEELLACFVELDDTEILHFLKQNADHEDPVLNILCKGILERKLFRVLFTDHPIQDAMLWLDQNYKFSNGLPKQLLSQLVFSGEESISYYKHNEEIQIVRKNGQLVPFSKVSEFPKFFIADRRYFIGLPKNS